MTWRYKRGLAETHQHWLRPRPSLVCQWLSEILPVIELAGLELRLSGRAITEPEQTWDVDCALRGQCSAEIIQDIQHQMLLTGFKHQLLIDPYWQNKTVSCYKKNNQWWQEQCQVWLLYPVELQTQCELKITDHRLNPKIPRITEYLVEFQYGQQPVKQKHQALLDKLGNFPTETAQEYLLKHQH